MIGVWVAAVSSWQDTSKMGRNKGETTAELFEPARAGAGVLVGEVNRVGRDVPTSQRRGVRPAPRLLAQLSFPDLAITGIAVDRRGGAERPEESFGAFALPASAVGLARAAGALQ